MVGLHRAVGHPGLLDDDLVLLLDDDDDHCVRVDVPWSVHREIPRKPPQPVKTAVWLRRPFLRLRKEDGEYSRSFCRCDSELVSRKILSHWHSLLAWEQDSSTNQSLLWSSWSTKRPSPPDYSSAVAPQFFRSERPPPALHHCVSPCLSRPNENDVDPAHRDHVCPVPVHHRDYHHGPHASIPQRRPSHLGWEIHRDPYRREVRVHVRTIRVRRDHPRDCRRGDRDARRALPCARISRHWTVPWMRCDWTHSSSSHCGSRDELPVVPRGLSREPSSVPECALSAVPMQPQLPRAWAA
jgi:hypothetical protein